MKIKERIKLLMFGLWAVLLFSAIIAFDIFRWHTFQDVTDSDVGYWKWRFIIDAKK